MPEEDRLSRKAWWIVADVLLGTRDLHARLLKALQERERELEKDPCEGPLASEAWEVLTDVLGRIDWHSAAGRFPENLARFLSDEAAAEGGDLPPSSQRLLQIARDYELPADFLAGIAREAVAGHARVLETLRRPEDE